MMSFIPGRIADLRQHMGKLARGFVAQKIKVNRTEVQPEVPCLTKQENIASQ